MALFHGWGSTASGLELLRGGIYFLPFKFPVIAGTHFLSISEARTTQLPKFNPNKGVLVLM